MTPLQSQEQQLIDRYSWSIFGCFCQQNPAAILALNRLLMAYDFTRIIELGTHTGGLSTLFALYTHGSRHPIDPEDPKEPATLHNLTHHKWPKTFHTFDNVVRDKNRVELLRDLGAEVGVVDFLNDQAAIDDIRNLIGQPGRTLLLCDGGNKKREFELYTSALKSFDFIMGHDWAKDEAAFEANKREGVWNSWELRMMDAEDDGPKFGIDKILKENNIQQVFSDEFDTGAWFCGISI